MSIKRRLRHVGIWAAIFLTLFYIGTNIVLPAEEAKELITALAEATTNIGDGDPLFIATHNIGISIIEFIPGVGFVWGGFSALQTGMIINVMSAEIESMEPWMGLLLFITPVGIIELAAYSLAMSRSWLWTRMLFSKERNIVNIKAMIKPTFVEIGILVGLLILGGYVESWMINEYGSMSLDLLDKYR